MLYPYLLYGNIIWGSAAKLTLWPVFKLQKRAIRMIAKVKCRESTSPAFKDLAMLRLPELYTYTVSLFMYNYAYNKLPELFNNYYEKYSSNYSTRQEGKYKIPLYKTSLGNYFVQKQGVLIWTKLTDSIEVNVTIGNFKKSVIEYLIKDY